MSVSRKTKKKIIITKKQNQLLKESLREFLGSGLLESKSKQTLSLFFLKDALSSRLLTPK